tara:strand:+ start:3482 stop:4201 length:720 start_codon:yes stop_codon:yes gene_type:complete
MIYVKFIRIILNYFDYFHQKKIINFFQQKFSKQITVVDVGAHFGETIKILKKNLNIEKIYSFEASPINFKVLEKNFPNNPLDIEIYNFALGTHTSESYINQTIESSSSTINSINKKSKYLDRKLKVLKIKNEDLVIKKIPIKIISLDEFIEEKKIKNIDILKIDTEGYEFNVLKGIKKNHYIIKMIYFEHHYDDMILKNYKFSEINKLLNDYGFSMVKKNKMLFRKSFEYIFENKINNK